jgi:ketosteroid isomerase-like protein
MAQVSDELRSTAEAAFGALNARDLDRFIALTAEDVEFTSMVAEMEGTTFRGHEGVRAWWETVVEAFGDVQWTVLDLRGPGEQGIAHVRMEGTLGGVPVNLSMWLAARLRDGRIIWWGWYRTEAEALDAV